MQQTGLASARHQSCRHLTGSTRTDGKPASRFYPGLLVVAWLAVPVRAEYAVATSGNLFYTDDVGIFSATRRLTRDADPTQPALDSRLTGQGSDGVFEPTVKLSDSFGSRIGKTTFDLQGGGFIFMDHTQYSNGTVQIQAQQSFTPQSKLLLRYYANPNLYLGNNEERASGHQELVPEQLTSQIGTLRFDQEVADGLELRLLSRYGTRRYDKYFQERNLNFWTIGPHMNWQVRPGISMGLAYHYERGLAQGHNQPQFQDDVSYANNYGSADVDVELMENVSFSLGLHYEHNNWLSHLQGDERNGAYENVYQGEALLNWHFTEKSKVYSGVQYSRRKASYDFSGIGNTNVGIGLQTTF